MNLRLRSPNFLLEMAGEGGWFYNGGMGNFGKFFRYLVGRELLTLLFYEDPPPSMLPTMPFSNFGQPSLPSTCLSPPTPNPTALSAVPFHWLNGWSCHISCANLRNDNMDLHISSLGTLVPEGLWCMFYATTHEVFWDLTQCVFLLALWFDIIHTKHSQHTQGLADWHTYINLDLK